MNNEEIRNRAKQLLNNSSIMTLNEKDIIENLMQIEDTDKTSLQYAEKTLKYIDHYLSIKEKLNFAQEDFKFLKELAENLRTQSIRKTDMSNPPLFKTKNNNGEDIFFITRKCMNEYLKRNNKNPESIGTVIEISSSNSMELEKLIDIIKRNF